MLFKKPSSFLKAESWSLATKSLFKIYTTGTTKTQTVTRFHKVLMYFSSFFFVCFATWWFSILFVNRQQRLFVKQNQTLLAIIYVLLQDNDDELLRFTISYYLLILYAVVIVKPALPLVGDSLSHEFNYMKHIATVHALYGANHAEKEMAAAADKDDAKQQGTQKTGESIPFHLLNEAYKTQPVSTSVIKPVTRFRSSFIEDILRPVIALPPKVVC